MAALAGAARAQHRHALVPLGRRDAARRPGGERARRAGRPRPGRRRRDAVPDRDRAADPRRGRRRGRCAATPARSRRSSGVAAEMRGVESIGAGADPAELARIAARSLGVVASVTGPVDHVSDGERIVAIANGHPLLASITGTGCMSSAVTGCFLAVDAGRPLDAAVAALVAFGVAGEDAARTRKGPARSTSPSTTRSRRSIPARSTDGRGSHEGARDRAPTSRRHAARRGRRDGRAAARQGARPTRSSPAATASAALGTTFVVNDDVDAALELGADGVHLGQSDRGAERARARGLAARPLGDDARAGARGRCGLPRASARSGRRPRRPTPIPPLGLDGLARDLRRGRRPGDRDRRHRRRERGRVHPRRAPPASPSIRAATDPALRRDGG